MAKLKARGRDEIYRIEKWKVPDPSRPYDRTKVTKALMSDGNILIKYDSGTWSVHGKIKPGLTPEAALKINLNSGYSIVNLSMRYFDRRGDTITMREGYDKPLISEAKAASRKKAAAKGAEKRKAESERRNGPGFYVTNVYAGPGLRSRIADHEMPFTTYESAEEFAWKRLKHFLELKFNYLLPVVIIETESREDAEGHAFIRHEDLAHPYGKGHVWWINGKHIGPPVDPRQMALFG